MLNLPPHFLFVLVKRDAKAVIMAFVGFFNIFGKVPKMAEKCQILVSAISKDMIGRWRTYSTDILRRFRALSFTKYLLQISKFSGFELPMLSGVKYHADHFPFYDRLGSKSFWPSKVQKIAKMVLNLNHTVFEPFRGQNDLGSCRSYYKNDQRTILLKMKYSTLPEWLPLST